MTPIHYLPGVICRLFMNSRGIILNTFRPNVTRWTAIVTCPITGINYRADLTPIKSAVEVKPLLTVDELLERGGI